MQRGRNANNVTTRANHKYFVKHIYEIFYFVGYWGPTTLRIYDFSLQILFQEIKIGHL